MKFDRRLLSLLGLGCLIVLLHGVVFATPGEVRLQQLSPDTFAPREDFLVQSNCLDVGFSAGSPANGTDTLELRLPRRAGHGHYPILLSPRCGGKASVPLALVNVLPPDAALWLQDLATGNKVAVKGLPLFLDATDLLFPNPYSSQPHPYVNAIENYQGWIALGTAAGVFIVTRNGEVIKTLTRRDGLPNLWVSALQTQDDLLVIGTKGGACVYQRERDALSCWSAPALKEIRALVPDPVAPQAIVWALGADESVFCLRFRNVGLRPESGQETGMSASWVNTGTAHKLGLAWLPQDSGHESSTAFPYALWVLSEQDLRWWSYQDLYAAALAVHSLERDETGAPPSIVKWHAVSETGGGDAGSGGGTFQPAGMRYDRSRNRAWLWYEKQMDAKSKRIVTVLTCLAPPLTPPKDQKGQYWSPKPCTLPDSAQAGSSVGDITIPAEVLDVLPDGDDALRIGGSTGLYRVNISKKARTLKARPGSSWQQVFDSSSEASSNDPPYVLRLTRYQANSKQADSALNPLFVGSGGRAPPVRCEAESDSSDKSTTGKLKCVSLETRPAGIGAAPATALLAGRKGRFWIGDGNGGVHLLLPQPRPPRDPLVTCVLGETTNAPSKNIVVGALHVNDRGLLVGRGRDLLLVPLDPDPDQPGGRRCRTPYGSEPFQKVPLNPSLPDDAPEKLTATQQITALAGDPEQSKVFIGTTNGLYIWESESGSKSELEPGLSQFEKLNEKTIYDLAYDSSNERDRILWVAAQQGIFAWHLDNVSRDGHALQNLQEEMGSWKVRSLTKGKAERLWAGTDGGDSKRASLFERSGDEGFAPIADAESMPHLGKILDLVEDSKENLWVLGTRAGQTAHEEPRVVYCLTKNRLWLGPFGPEHGLDLNQNSALGLDPDNRLWIGRSITRYTPNVELSGDYTWLLAWGLILVITSLSGVTLFACWKLKRQPWQSGTVSAASARPETATNAGAGVTEVQRAGTAGGNVREGARGSSQPTPEPQERIRESLSGIGAVQDSFVALVSAIPAGILLFFHFSPWLPLLVRLEKYKDDFGSIAIALLFLGTACIRLCSGKRKGLWHRTLDVSYLLTLLVVGAGILGMNVSALSWLSDLRLLDETSSLHVGVEVSILAGITMLLLGAAMTWTPPRASSSSTPASTSSPDITPPPRVRSSSPGSAAPPAPVQGPARTSSHLPPTPHTVTLRSSTLPPPSPTPMSPPQGVTGEQSSSPDERTEEDSDQNLHRVATGRGRSQSRTSTDTNASRKKRRRKRRKKQNKRR